MPSSTGSTSPGRRSKASVKHNGPLSRAPSCRRPSPITSTRPRSGARHLAVGRGAGRGAADDIAYNNHDIDDGLRAGLFALDDLADVPLVGPIFAEVAARHPGLEEPRLIHEAIRRLIDRMVGDLIAETRRRIAAARARSGRRHPRACRRRWSRFPTPMREQRPRRCDAFLFEHMYRHYRVNRMASKARRIVHGAVRPAAAPSRECLPTEWQAQARRAGHARDRARRRRLYRRHDRPLRARRALPPVRQVRDDVNDIFRAFPRRGRSPRSRRW